MPSYKLYYFDLKGRAEAIRMLFAYAGVEFEDIRISFDEWPTKKAEMPYRQMPVLEVDGKRYCQSSAILRYLAREFKLAGKTSLDEAKADEFAEACQDVMSKLPLKETDEDKKDELMNKALTETVPAILALIEENMAGEYYTDEVTYADIAFAFGAWFLMDIRPDLFDNTPKLKALQERIYKHPNIQKYMNE